jgi:hypothetical protein
MLACKLLLHLFHQLLDHQATEVSANMGWGFHVCLSKRAAQRAGVPSEYSSGVAKASCDHIDRRTACCTATDLKAPYGLDPTPAAAPTHLYLRRSSQQLKIKSTAHFCNLSNLHNLQPEVTVIHL